MFDVIDATGTARKDDPRMRNVEREMIRSHALCLKISSKKPTDPDYKALLEELFQCEIDDSNAKCGPKGSAQNKAILYWRALLLRR